MSWQAKAYLALSPLLSLVAPALLQKRLKRGKELPARWREKLGEPSLPRPEGRLIWLHAVGLGEVLALRGLIRALSALDPELEFLVTSSATSSAIALDGQMPPKTRHQFLPVDAPHYLARFLDHWRPSLSVWAEQDLWPGAVLAADRAGIPLAMVNARMNAASYAKRRKAAGLYGDLLRRFRLIAAQDEASATHLRQLGAGEVKVTGSLKAAAPPLACDEAELLRLRQGVRGRRVWLLSSSHPEDEGIALAAHERLLQIDPDALLLIAPRDPHRGAEILAHCAERGLLASIRSQGLDLSASIGICDSFGEMGLWYRASPVTLVGGTFSEIEGHNPWEPIALGSAALHGPHIANFRNDYDYLQGKTAVMQVTPEGLAEALTLDHRPMVARAEVIHLAARDSLAPLARDLLSLVS